MKDLLKKLEDESMAISLASGKQQAIKIATNLAAYASIILFVKKNPDQSLLLLEEIEKVSQFSIDEKYANPNDNFVFVMLLLLKQINREYISENGQFNLALEAVFKMKNIFWAATVRHDNFLEIMYDGDGVDRTRPADVEICEICELLNSHNFEKVNNLLIKINISHLPTSIMYGILHVVSSYVNYLPSYSSFWDRVRTGCIERINKDKNDERSIEDVDVLLFHLKKENIESDWVFSIEKDQENKNRKSIEASFDELVLAKIQLAKDLKDDDLFKILTYYYDRLKRDKEQNEKYHSLSSRLGDQELKKLAIKSLRAMADKLEAKGSGFIIGCDLPSLPIHSNDEYVSHIEVTLAKGPLGG